VTSNRAKECEREIENIQEAQKVENTDSLKVKAWAEPSWDYAMLLTAQGVQDLHHVVQVSRIDEVSQETELFDFLSEIQWQGNAQDRSNIFVTQHFLQTIQATPYQQFLRQVEYVVLFRNKTVLLLSEREADGYLAAYYNQAAVSSSHTMLLHRCRFDSTADSRCAIGLNDSLETSSQVALMPFNGDTEYDLKHRDRAFREVLKFKLSHMKAREGIENFVKTVRGKGHRFELSDLQAVCYQGI
jgi:hypothetical protein